MSLCYRNMLLIAIGRDLESTPSIFFKLVGCYIISTCWFYIIHRLSHRIRWVYANIPHIHHRWIYPDPWSTLYAHPLENIVVNLGLAMIPLEILNASSSLCFIWFSLLSVNGILSHSGPIFSSNVHDIHHKYMHRQFGVGTFWDTFFKSN